MSVTPGRGRSARLWRILAGTLAGLLIDRIVEAWERFSQSLVEELAPLDNK